MLASGTSQRCAAVVQRGMILMRSELLLLPRAVSHLILCEGDFFPVELLSLLLLGFRQCVHDVIARHTGISGVL